MFFSGALDTVKNALLDMEGSKKYVGASSNVNRNWMHNMLEFLIPS